ncbi:uncharacterized protein MYCFIDRAFT_187042 [Pseudocercospora fijiensis CIRAD86]|uniref:Uncharacterized protein n=1 Tax=Pseudocercospora fijiensis (strain CIRAD86) TaxID=383855 RepID=M3AR44_PSEFD|nr:uncharacterized protein MYCFIDRAFT_187042 [Pseudocercospora fijiensis CIRAD86]EME87096.1 hypothetical protein MYCFIDRAFT_187042 [Pseudocercospora fijiensis CIRAD86]
MADALVTYFRQTLPPEVGSQVESHIKKLEEGDLEALLRSSEARTIFGHGHEQTEKLENVQRDAFPDWNDFIFQRLSVFLADRSSQDAITRQAIAFCIGYAALLAFVQSNVTGPPITYRPAHLVLPPTVGDDEQARNASKQKMLAGLTMDGVAAYKLTPHIELLCLSEAIMTTPPILKNIKAARWAKLRTSFLHQRLLSEVSSTLQNVIYDDLDVLDTEISSHGKPDIHNEFVLERSTIHIHHGLDKFAREDLEKARQERHFEFALTGLLGKRTKFQQKDVSQLVVLAKSATGHENGPLTTSGNGNEVKTKPETLDLNDDTLLEAISFSEKPKDTPSTEIQSIDSLPPSLKELDPANQPQLQPLDSVILLSLASSIKNTQPEDGLTREETLPYATRVLDGGSSNWQVYTQALLVRSRIEGFRARTTERGLLQLQALVDQVVADTTPERSSGKENAGDSTARSTFLPKAKESESAPASERLRYIFQLATPTRWELEAELANRWVQLGGLRSALDIYERLQMWAEAALCWAATEREDKAKRIVRRQLFHATAGGPDVPEDNVAEDEEWKGPARSPPPLDAPRLYCILGDIDQDISWYEEAWKVSGERYARAQRSIGRYFYGAGPKKDMVRAADAYSKSLRVNQLNHQSWFALGCALLELAEFNKAVEAFSRCVQLDETDAEAWSNLAAALLRTDEDENQPTVAGAEPSSPNPKSTISKRNALRHDALQALKRAASLKRDSYRIWENVLIVSASLEPPDYPTILSAQRQILVLRGPTEGEKSIDTQILSKLINHTITSSSYDPSQPGLARILVKFLDESVIPLITSSAELWHLVSKVAGWRDKPSAALEAEEKAWRVVTSRPGWETESEERWEVVVEATVRLVESYERFGSRERTEGMGAGSGEVVMRDWRFKARSA